MKAKLVLLVYISLFAGYICVQSIVHAENIFALTVETIKPVNQYVSREIMSGIKTENTTLIYMQSGIFERPGNILFPVEGCRLHEESDVLS